MEVSEKMEEIKLNYDCIFHIISFLDDVNKFRLFSLDKMINQNKKKIPLDDYYNFGSIGKDMIKFNMVKINYRGSGRSDPCWDVLPENMIALKSLTEEEIPDLKKIR